MQRVAVGRCFHQQLGGDNCVGTRAVFNDDRLAPDFGKLLAERAGDDIDAAARRETDEYAHGTRWIRLCVRVRCRKADNGERRDYDTNR